MLHIANFIRKYWIIFAIVVLYFFLAGLNLLPRGLNIFKKSKLLIDDTPVVVKEIRELGELTTSEFYGEVYADLNEVYDNLLNSIGDSVEINSDLYYHKYSGLEEYIKNSGNFRSQQLEFNSAKERYATTQSEYLKKLEDYQNNKKSLEEEIEQNQGNKKERRKLESRLDDLRKKMGKEKKNFEDIKKDFKKLEDNYRKKRLDFWEIRKKRNLVYIGRGWVKAGIDLKQINEEDIIMDEDDSASIQILIADPVILDADINPWYIYTGKEEDNIKGFEVFIAKTGSILSNKNFTDNEVTELKKLCKDKLRQDAIDKGLLKNAENSAIQTLENFFRLVGFKKVGVHFKSRTEVVSTEE